MPLIAQGGTATIRANVIDGAGNPADPDTLVLTLRDPAGDIVTGFPVDLAGGDVVRDALGSYHYAWALAADQATGTYLAYWTGTESGVAISDLDPEEWIVTTAGAITTASPYGAHGVYLTLARAKVLDVGISLASISDVALMGALRQAKVATDRFCNAPTEPVPYDFRGGSISDERHEWIDPTQRRVYPFHQPIKKALGISVDATNKLYIEFAQSELYVNATEGYIEITNMTIGKIGIWNIADVPVFGLIQPVGRVSYTYGYDYSITDEVLTPIGTDGAKWLADNGFWDTQYPTSVKQDGTTLAEGAYTLDAESGIVTLDTPDPSAVLTASYTHHLPHDVAEAQPIIFVDRLVDRGFAKFTGFEEVQVEELRMRRPRAVRGESKSKIPPDAADYLGAYVFSTLR